MSDRFKSEDLIHALSRELHVRGLVVRMPPEVHDAGQGGFIPRLIQLYQQSGKVLYIDDGSARWAAVHRSDTAVLLRLALEKAASCDSSRNGQTADVTYHAIAEQGIPMKNIAQMIGKHLKLPVESQSVQEAETSLGFPATIIGAHNPVSSEKTKRKLGWSPSGIALLDDMEANYFS